VGGGGISEWDSVLPFPSPKARTPSQILERARESETRHCL